MSRNLLRNANLPPDLMDPILIVDDERDNLEALRRLLRNQYAVTALTSPFEALKLVQTEHFHVILSDQRMPEMSGVELLEKIKNVSPATVRILLTGYTDIESVIGAINRGNIYRYVAKPWDPEDLKLTLRQANEAYQLRRELEKKNQELEKTNADLKKALEDLRLLDRAKARFISLVSHELNTPLTILNSFVGLLRDKQTTLSGDLQKAVASVGSASDRFAEIVAEVLAYVKLESENRLQRQDFDLVKETRRVQKDLTKSFEKKAVTLTVQAEGAPKLKVDSDKMRVAIRKLLEDALLRSPEKGAVKVSVEERGAQVRYAVWRGGESLSKEAFQPFETSAEEMHHQRNLGLGLAICRQIVETHGGKLELESSTSKGTTICIVLPL